MKLLSLPLFFGILFSAIGTAALLITRDVLMAAIWLCFGNGLLLSTFKFKRADEAGNMVPQPIPSIRMLIGLFLIISAVLLLVFQVYMDTQHVPAK